MLKLSKFLNTFNEPETLKMAKLARSLRAAGHDVIDLSLGEPDFNTPEHIKEAGIKAIHDNWSHYTPVAGFLDLREAVCSKLKNDNNLIYTPEEIIVSTGAKQSLANVILSLVDEGDDVLIPTPYWVTYSELVKIARGKVVEIPTTVNSNFKINAAQLEAAITDKTKLFLFSSPCNPSGAVYSAQELAELANVFLKYPDIYIISDEIYEYINYVGKHASIAHCEALKDRVIVVNGLSKGYAMTGWRLGYIAADKHIVKACDKVQGQFTSGTCSIAQKAAIAALLGSKTCSFDMTQEFEKRRNLTLELMQKIPGFNCTKPDGAFYVFPDISYYFGKSIGNETIKDSADFSMFILNNAYVSSVMGAAFGDAQCVRFSYANSIENIKKAWTRIHDILKNA
ncbi:MAG: pyridoxal phosphate-dependent aminotransferase [Alphaproteobacteria bacterium]|nr:pyridoxal phosphate-dependent aminotransferase [Alphaproteobacteria bacterium]